LIDGCLHIEQDGLQAVKVPVKFAEIACCHKSGFPSCSTASIESSLLAVMPESMTAAGAIRTDYFEEYTMGNFLVGKGSFAQVHFAYPRGQQQ